MCTPVVIILGAVSVLHRQELDRSEVRIVNVLANEDNLAIGRVLDDVFRVCVVCDACSYVKANV